MGLFSIDLTKELSMEEMDLAARLLFYLGKTGNEEEKSAAAILSGHLFADPKFSKNELAELAECLSASTEKLIANSKKSGSEVSAEDRQMLQNLIDKVSSLE